jgi:uncharacterized heparinase superfamily protein
MKLWQFARFYHTVRHLRPVQIVNRIQRQYRRPRWDAIPAPPQRQPAARWSTICERPASLVAPDRLQVFEQTYPLRFVDDWCNDDLPHLVRYNLHYFDDLVARGAAERRAWHAALIDRWIDQNPPGHGPGWEPYPLSLRIANWIKWSLGGHSLSPTQSDSLATQAQALEDQLEFHLMANHLLANAKALVFAGSYFTGPVADRWLRRGNDILLREIPEQILPDGGHFELSPMYHSIILEDLLDLVNLTQVFPISELRWTDGLQPILARMQRWLRAMTHPDGQIAFFNDAAFGIAADPDALDRYARQLGAPGAPDLAGESVVHLADSGYVRLQRGASVLLLDVAPVGPDYQPGHAHADTLSFEWSLGRQRVIVNSGTSCYGVGPERLRQRSTSAHSTVEVDQQDSSEVWSGFRVGRRARPGPVEIEETSRELRVAGSHDGYQRLPGRVRHQRQWTLTFDRLHVGDTLNGEFRRAVARFPLHPEVSPSAPDEAPPGAALAFKSGAWALQAHIIGGRPGCVRSTYHPRFDVETPNFCVESHFDQPAHELQFEWSPR